MALLDFGTASPLARAIESISARTPIGSVLRSADWANVPLALRESAQFSAGVESARFLQRVQDRITQVLKLERSRLAGGGTGAFFDRSKFIAELQKIAREEGLTPADPEARGTIADPTSEGRLGMIFDIQTQRAQGYAKWKMDMDPDVLAAFPAQEMIRVEDREVPRGMRRTKAGLVSDPATAWSTRWVENDGRLIEGTRLVALKTDPIWTKISRFGTPWPPFDFRSGMGLVDVRRRDAVALGLLKQGERVQPVDGEFTDKLQASAQGLSERTQRALETIFGEQVSIFGGTATWHSTLGAGGAQP